MIHPSDRFRVISLLLHTRPMFQTLLSSLKRTGKKRIDGQIITMYYQIGLRKKMPVTLFESFPTPDIQIRRSMSADQREIMRYEND